LCEKNYDQAVAGFEKAIALASARAMAVLSARPAKIEINGASVQQDCPPAGSGFLLTPPRGQHLVQVEAAASHG